MSAIGRDFRRLAGMARWLYDEITVGAVAAVLVLLWGVTEDSPGGDALAAKPLTAFENTLLDIRYEHRGARPTPSEVVIVGIDDASMTSLGKFPWPRMVYGRFLRKLKEYGPAAIGLDIMFLDPEAPREIDALESMEAYLNDRLAVPGLDETERARIEELLVEVAETKERLSGDPEFVAAIEELDVLAPVIAFDCKFVKGAGARGLSATGEQALRDFGYTENIDLPVRNAVVPLPQSVEVQLPVDDVLDLCGGLGYATVLPDSDGVIRHLPFAIWFEDKVLMKPLCVEILISYYFSLDEAHPRAMDIRAEFTVDRGAFIMGDHRIPLDEQGRITLNYYGPPRTFPYVSFVDVVNGTVPADALAGKIVIVGSTTTGIFDHYPSPFSQYFPGVEIQSTFVANALDDSFLKKVSIPEATVEYAVGVVLVAIVVALAIRLQRAILGAVLTMLLMGAWIVFTFSMFKNEGLWIHTATPLVAVGFAFATAMIRRVVREEVERRKLRKFFAPMVSEEVMQELQKNPDIMKLGGEDRVITCAFTDLAGFTTLSEQLTADAMGEVLTQYFTEMSAAIKSNNGYVDKFMGDGIMAEFGAPIASDRHALEACRAAVEMKDRLARMNADFAARSLTPVGLRVGLHTGKCRVGNFGTHDRFNYTAMGDPVNLASRMEGVNKAYKTVVLVTEDVLREAGESIRAREIDRIRVVGKQEPTKIYELLSVEGENGHPAEPDYGEGLVKYRERDWTSAVECFKRALERAPEDGPTQVMLTRCAEILAQRVEEPKEGWDGVYEMKSK